MSITNTAEYSHLFTTTPLAGPQQQINTIPIDRTRQIWGKFSARTVRSQYILTTSEIYYLQIFVAELVTKCIHLKFIL